jgi:glycosyltransferase involved in cell wall biosynthesis
MERDLVSVIIPVFNRAGMLREAISTASAQTWPHVEIIVVDDGSTDETVAVIGTLAATVPRVHSLRISNAGPGAAREAGLKVAKGEFIQFLDSDDLLDARKFELQIRMLRERADCGVAYCKARLIHPDGSADPIPSRRTGEEISTIFPAMLQSRWWETAAPLYRASVVHANGPWLPLRAEEDWEYDCRLGARGVCTCFVNEWLCSHRRHSGNLSGHFDVATMRDRAIAHSEVFKHAQRAAISTESKEMQHFARELFLLSRQCGSLGMSRESSELFELSRAASGARRNQIQFILYGLGAKVLGWRLAGRISASIDRLRQ